VQVTPREAVEMPELRDECDRRATR
jgi:hypothetical protein